MIPWEEAGKCKYKEYCCFRNGDKTCEILKNTDFEDGCCHFRKLVRDEANLYDAERKRRKRCG